MNWNAEWDADWGADWQGGGVVSTVATAAVSGTLLTANELNIVNGGRTLQITLTNDTWVAAGAAFEAIRQDIIDGVSASNAEIFGWNGEVRDNEVVGSVVRVSSTQVLITWTAAADYDIAQNELIIITVPASAVVGGVAIIATPGMVVDALTGMLAVRGRKPVRRKISGKSIVIALDGPEKAYPHYQCSNRQFFAKPNHNPFKGL